MSPVSNDRRGLKQRIDAADDEEFFVSPVSNDRRGLKRFGVPGGQRDPAWCRRSAMTGVD